MIFSSWPYIFLFLPIVFFGYFFLNRTRLILLGKVWLVAASLVFYSYWSIKYLPLLLGSICFNFTVGTRLPRFRPGIMRWWILAGSIAANLGLLGYFKYANFFVENVNWVCDAGWGPMPVIIPLGISFFTFTQIAYLVDCYRGKVEEYSFLNYALFVTFFPHLIAGPILHHADMMPQFKSRWTLPIRYRNILLGLIIFSIGLFKKVVIADTFAIWANAGFDVTNRLDFFSAWTTSLSYTFQLYFDFSGYSDMAIGSALLFNIWLPINFNSPYKALDIQDFWRRWHITLSRFLRDYLYFPLGGSRHSTARTLFNIMVTFVLGGLWHGASWMFIIWGVMHGAALVIHRLWGFLRISLPTELSWLITFNFINIGWVFFRAKTLHDAQKVLKGMVDLGSVWSFPLADVPTFKLAWGGTFMDQLLRVLPLGLAVNLISLPLIATGFVILRQKNSTELMLSEQSDAKLAWVLTLFCIALYFAVASKSTVFLYYTF